MVNYTRTMLLGIDKAHITTKHFPKLIQRVGTGNILVIAGCGSKPAENDVNEYAL